MKIKKYKKLRGTVQRRRNKNRNKNKFLKLTNSIFYVTSTVWLAKKKLTWLTLLSIGYALGHNSAEHQVYKEHIQTSQKEVHKLQEQFNYDQEIQLQKIRSEIQEKEQLRTKYLAINEKLEKTAEEVIQTKLERNELINHLEKIIVELNLKSKKEHTNLDGYKKYVTENTKKLEEDLNEKKSDIFKLKYVLHQKIEETINCLKKIQLLEISLKEKINKIETFEMQNKQDFQTIANLEKVIEELQLRLIEKEQKFSEYTEDILKIRSDLTELKNKLISLENKGHINSILYALERLVGYKIIGR
jgi:chromosome segregation ATPase